MRLGMCLYFYGGSTITSHQWKWDGKKSAKAVADGEAETSSRVLALVLCFLSTRFLTEIDAFNAQACAHYSPTEQQTGHTNGRCRASAGAIWSCHARAVHQEGRTRASHLAVGQEVPLGAASPVTSRGDGFRDYFAVGTVDPHVKIYLVLVSRCSRSRTPTLPR